MSEGRREGGERGRGEKRVKISLAKRKTASAWLSISSGAPPTTIMESPTLCISKISIQAEQRDKKIKGMRYHTF